MLHGNPTWSFYYRNLVLGLRDTYRTIVPDHIGCGLSDKPDDSRYDYTLAAARRRPGSAARSSGPARQAHAGAARLGRHDRHGLCHRHPERIKRLVILNTAAFPLPQGKRLPLVAVAVPQHAAGAAAGSRLQRLLPRRRALLRSQAAAGRSAAGYLAPYDSWAQSHRRAALRAGHSAAPGDRGFDLVQEVQDGLQRFAACRC